MLNLYDYQIDAIHNMHNGCILCGGVGTGKSLTALGYHYILCGGDEGFLSGGSYVKPAMPMDIYIITTAHKRDTREWQKDAAHFLIEPIVDSWNNIEKYVDVEDAFIIFDEQRVVGNGSWVKAFLKIAKKNRWILLSATPGDTWMDYVPVFLANGFFKNRSEFIREHVVYSRFTKFPSVQRYLGEGRLIRMRKALLVDMDAIKVAEKVHEDVIVPFDVSAYHDISKTRWNPWRDEPITNASELCYSLRRVVNSGDGRQQRYLELLEDHPKAIVFYNFDYELEILLNLGYSEGTEVRQWNGHKHEPVPDGDKWVYLVQYTAGAEGWNCTATDTIIFYSQNYSYKVMVQASGRIDRLNTPYKILYYYHLKSRAGIDLAIAKALKDKKKFNETKWIGGAFNGYSRS